MLKFSEDHAIFMKKIKILAEHCIVSQAKKTASDFILAPV